MTKTQRKIIATLAIIAIAVVGATGFYAWSSYRDFASQPLGPALPVASQTLPALWTSTPGAPADSVNVVVPAVAATNTPAPLCGGPAVMNILAIGQDQRSDNYMYGLGDVIRVVRVDFTTPKVTVLEFPRDLWVQIPYISDNLNGFDHGKLNQSYLYGQPGDGFGYWDGPSQGPGLMSLTLNLNFGVNTDHYVAVNMRTFEKMVNALGGITVNIPDIKTAHNTGLPVGKHHLGGSEALKVARNRQEGMSERVSNQNLVLCAMRDKLLSPSTVTKIPQLIQTFQDNIQTDFTPDQLSQLACLGTQLPVQNIVFASFPHDLLKEDVRIYDDPQYPKGTLVTLADFDVLRDYVTRFQTGVWPQPTASTAAEPETDEEKTSSSFCP
jgi:LCP family protein required for cell wall assembly